MNRLGKIVLLLASMVTIEYVAHAQTDTYHTGEEGFGISYGESSVSRFDLGYCHDCSDIGEPYLDNAVNFAQIHRCVADPALTMARCEQNALPELIETAERVEHPLTMPHAPLDMASELQPKPKVKHTILGLKTNMLYDAVTVLNFSIEGAISRKFSILYEQHCPWWLTSNNRYCLEILSFGGEFRWWFKSTTGKYASRTDWVQRDALVGHFLGIYGLAGDFDVQAKRKGCYQGEFVSVGLTYGYAMPIGKRLNLEFSLSVGYANVPYRHYIPTDDYELLLRDRSKDGRMHYVGPTKIEIALVVPIRASSRAKGGRR